MQTVSPLRAPAIPHRAAYDQDEAYRLRRPYFDAGRRTHNTAEAEYDRPAVLTWKLEPSKSSSLIVSASGAPRFNDIT